MRSKSAPLSQPAAPFSQPNSASSFSPLVTPPRVAGGTGVLESVIVLSNQTKPTTQGVLTLCPVLPRRAGPSNPFASVLRVCSSMPPVSFGQLVTAPLIRLDL